MPPSLTIAGTHTPFWQTEPAGAGELAALARAEALPVRAEQPFGAGFGMSIAAVAVVVDAVAHLHRGLDGALADHQPALAHGVARDARRLIVGACGASHATPSMGSLRLTSGSSSMLPSQSSSMPLQISTPAAAATQHEAHAHLAIEDAGAAARERAGRALAGHVVDHAVAVVVERRRTSSSEGPTPPSHTTCEPAQA